MDIRGCINDWVEKETEYQDRLFLDDKIQNQGPVGLPRINNQPEDALHHTDIRIVYKFGIGKQTSQENASHLSLE
jgi:hypothetical protein